MLIVTSCDGIQCAFQITCKELQNCRPMYQKSSSFLAITNSIHNTQREISHNCKVIWMWSIFSLSLSLSHLHFDFFRKKKMVFQNGTEPHWTVKRALWSTTPFIIVSHTHTHTLVESSELIGKRVCSVKMACNLCTLSKTTPNLCSRCQSITSNNTNPSIYYS